MRRKKLFFLCSLPIIIVSFIFVFIMFYTSNSVKELSINQILETESYSYLSSNAKDFIVKYYETNGVVLLTEKNKEENLPYLNQEYVEYLELPPTEKKKVEVIPQETLVDYVYDPNKEVSPEGIEDSKYDLRDVNGKNYVTPLKNQGSFGLCWAFATNAHAESHLLVTRNKEYSEDAIIFSERHTDFLTSYDGIIDGNPYLPIRDLTGGGFFTDVMKGATNAFSFVDTSFNGGVGNYSYSGKLYRKDVFVTKNALYEVNETSDFTRLDLINETDENKKTAFKNEIKRMIVDYGGLWVATDFYCKVTINSQALVNVTPNCTSGGRHALQVIGWNDDFEYSVCETTSGSISTNVDGCTGTVYTGKGVWILKNSWGNSTSYPYLAYDSKKTDFNGIISMSEGTSWDNNGFTFNNLGNSTKYISKFGSNFSKIFSFSNKDDESKTEELKKIKFNVTATNQEFDFYLINGNRDVVDVDSYIKLSNQATTHRGFYTIDLSTEDIVLNNEFSILVYPKSTSSVNVNQVYVFSDNVGSDISINTLDVLDKTLEISSVKEHIFEISSFTSNIMEGEEIEYRIVSKTAGEIDVDYRFERSIVYNNEVFAKIYIDGTLPLGEYYIQSIYNGVVYDTSLLTLFFEPIVTQGSGTISDPYLIESSKHLSLINEDRMAYFKLTSDIDLTYDTQNSEGFYYNDGKGWEPISYSNTSSVNTFGFSGGLDGNGYKIKGLYINRPDENYVGLFKGLYPISTTKNIVKNITFENVDITGANYTAALAGNMSSEEGDNYLIVKDIFVKNGNIKGNNYVGSIAGQIRGGSSYSLYIDGTSYSSRNVFDRLYNNASIFGSSYVGGIIGYVSNQYTSYKPGKLIFTNLHSNGIVQASSSYGSVFGYLYHTSNYNIIVNNSISSRIYDGGEVKIVGSQYKSTSSAKNSKLELNNVYYNGAITLDSDNIVLTNTLECGDLECFKNATYWSDFTTCWELETIDNVKRIPFLKNANVEYTRFDSINLNPETPYLNLYDLVIPNNSVTRDFSYEVVDSKIASVDGYGIIYGVKNGSTSVKIYSNYDGFAGEVEVNVDNVEMSSIVFNSNGGTEVSSIIKNIGEEVSAPTPPTKEHYEFVGWYTDNETFANKYTFSTMPSESITLFAKWEIKKYTIQFHANSGEGSMSSITQDYQTLVTLVENSFTRKGHTFSYWNTEADGSGSIYFNKRRFRIVKDLTLYAQWTPDEYTLEFDANGGEGTMESQYFTYDVPAYISENLFTKTDYVFVGWNTEADGSGKFYSNKELISLEESTILYAQWILRIHNITFSSNGGKGTMEVQPFVYGEKQRLNENLFTRGGYDFDSWNTKADGSGIKYTANQNVIVNEDLTLYAQWKEAYSYIIGKYKYDSNYIKNIPINTKLIDFKNNIILNDNYSIFVNYKVINGNYYLYTGGKTIIYKNDNIFYQYTNVVNGDVNGDGKINYLDYVNIYNHIYKTKHSNSEKKLLYGEFLVSADMNNDNKINYLDYVNIYNNIRNMKGGE